MTIATMMNADDPSFSFDHDQLHRAMRQRIAPGSLTALLDPLIGADIPSGYWQTFHAQAHADFASAFPAIYWPSTSGVVDVDLRSEGSDEWWTFSNWQLHNLALTA